MKKSRLLGEVHACLAVVLICGISPISIAANNIDLNSDPTNSMITDDGAGNFTSNDDGANLNVGDISSAWSNNYAVTIATTESGTSSEPGIINLGAALDFNGYIAPLLTLSSHSDININAVISDSDATGDSLTLNLMPVGAVNLNSAIGMATNTTISGNLDIGASGTYNLTGATDSLTVDSITNTSGGAFNFTAGSLTLNSGLNIDGTGLLGPSVALAGGQNLHTTTQAVGTGVSTSGSVTHTGGSNTVDGALTVNAGGSYALDGGSLTAGSINNSAGGSFTFNSGSLSLTNSGLTIGSGGLLGSNVTLNAARSLTSVSGNVTVNSNATLLVNGGSTNSPQHILGGLINNGSTSLTAGGYIRAEGGIINDGAGASITLSGTSDSYDIDYGTSGYLRTSTITNTNGANITLDGGVLQASSITNTNNASFTYNSGVLDLHNLSIGTGGPLGDDFTLDASKFLWVTNNGAGALTIDAGSNFTLDGGSLVVGSINNAGTFTFTSGRVQVDGNAGITIGNGGEFGNALSLGNNSRLTFADMTGGGGGMFTVDAGASFSLNGGELYMNDAVLDVTGDFDFNSGLLRMASNALTVGSSGLLGDVVALGNGKRLTTEQTVTIDSGASLTVNGGYLGADSGINNNGNFSFSSGGLSLGGGLNVGNTGLLGNNVALSSNRTLNVGGGVTIEAGANWTQSGGTSGMHDGLVNNGNINVSGGIVFTSGDVTNSNTVIVGSGATFGERTGTSKPSAGSYVQDMGRTVVNGILSSASVAINGGQLTGSGIINGDLAVAGGLFGPGNSPGTMEVTGNFVLTDAGTLHLEIGSDGSSGYLWDQLIVGGEYDVQGGLVKFSLLDGFGIDNLETDFTMFDFFRTGTAGSDVDIDLLQMASFLNADLYAHDIGLDSWYTLAFDTTTGVFTSVPSASPVPLPAAAWLFGSGLLGLIGMARRKKVA